MKAWQQLVDDPDKTLYITRNSTWWLESGVKIERFDTGLIEVNNVMKSGDNYHEATPDQLYYFNTYGWWQGVYKVWIDTYTTRLDKAEQRLKYAANEEIRDSEEANCNELKETVNEYKIKLEESLVGLE